VSAIVELQAAQGSDLFWNTWVCRPPAAAIVYLLSRTGVTPNQVTLSAFVVAMISAALIVTLPGHWGIVVAIIVFELSYVLDCADGMLARLRNVQSTPGHLLDFLMDEIKAFVILGAVAVRLWREQHETSFLLLGIGGLVALATGISITTFQRRPEIAPPAASASAQPKPKPSILRRVVGLAESVAKFLIHYPSYILYAALLGRIEVYFYPYIAVNGLYALRALGWLSFRFGRR
jgi:hypothetical protein